MTEKYKRGIYKASDGPTVLYFGVENSNDIRIFHQENEIMPVPKSEQFHKIYGLLKENCDLIFCTDDSNEDFKFITLEYFVIFATDSKGNCFGTIGGSGDIQDKDYPVGYITIDGKCGKIASNLKEFLELVNYYPYWSELIEMKKKGLEYRQIELENLYHMKSFNYMENQKEISKELGLTRNEDSIDLLMANLTDDNQFIVFGNRYDNLL